MNFLTYLTYSKNFKMAHQTLNLTSNQINEIFILLKITAYCIYLLYQSMEYIHKNFIQTNEIELSRY